MSYKFSQFNVIESTTKGFLIYNTFSKALLSLDKKNEKIFLSGDVEKFDKAVQEKLVQNGFLVDKNFDEITQLEKYYLHYRKNSEHLYLTLLPTFQCNFECPYCFEGEKTDKSKINVDILKKFSQKQFPNWKHIHIALFGGEPLLEVTRLQAYFDFLNEHCKSNGYTYSTGIATNGYLLTEKVMKMLVNEWNCSNMQITIDGCRATHNATRILCNKKSTYDVIIKNIKNAIHTKSNMRITLRINLLNNTLSDVGMLLDEFSKADQSLFDIYFRPIYNTKTFYRNNENANNLSQFYQLALERGFTTKIFDDIKFFYCEADGGIEQITICPDMSIWKCINDMDFDDAHIGDISPDGSAIYNKSKIENWTKNSPFLDMTCRSCKYLPICWGGCPLQYNKNKKRKCFQEKGFNFLFLK